MKRKDFLYLSGIGASALLLPDLGAFANPIDPLQALEKIDVKIKKELADVALNAAKAKGASYTDVRIGRYLNQFVSTRDKRVQGVANTESFGVGIRVIANGCWGFAAIADAKSEADTARAAEEAVAIAKANAQLSEELGIDTNSSDASTPSSTTSVAGRKKQD